MSKKTRRIILLICSVLFFIITPIIVLYSLGYRIDFEEKKIVATGGIYVKALPLGANIIIDSKISNKTSILSNYVFVQNLLPKQHSILIKKDGYYDYQKNLAVKENEVTKLEQVVLFKKNIAFETIKDPSSGTEFTTGQEGKMKSPFNQQVIQDKYIIKNNNLYYSNIKSNENLSPTQKNTPIIKNIIAYKTDGNIIWLGLDGFLYSSDLNGLPAQAGKNIEKLSQINLKVNKKKSYLLLEFGKNIFLKENNDLLLFDSEAKSFINFYTPIKDLKISPDGQKIIYYNDYEILFSSLNSDITDKVLLNRFSEKINNCYWLNDDYLIFELENKIIISEIDNRDRINTINLPEKISLADGTLVDFKKPLPDGRQAKIFFDQQDKKLYILSENNLLVSERLLP